MHFILSAEWFVYTFTNEDLPQVCKRSFFFFFSLENHLIFELFLRIIKQLELLGREKKMKMQKGT